MADNLHGITKQHLGVILVDMQAEFLEKIDSIEIRTQIAAQIDVLEACISSDIPLAVLEFKHYGQTDAALRPYIKATPRHAYFTKHYDDGFTNRKLEPKLRAWGVDSVCMMGVSAAFCVKKTAESALERGFRIVTARQLIASQTYRQEEFRKCIPWFEANGTYSGDYRDIIQMIRAHA